MLPCSTNDCNRKITNEAYRRTICHSPWITLTYYRNTPKPQLGLLQTKSWWRHNWFFFSCSWTLKTRTKPLFWERIQWFRRWLLRCKVRYTTLNKRGSRWKNKVVLPAMLKKHERRIKILTCAIIHVRLCAFSIIYYTLKTVQ